MKSSENVVYLALIILLLSAACVIPVFGQDVAAGADDHGGVAAVILHTNDIHCAYEDNIGFDGLVLYKNSWNRCMSMCFWWTAVTLFRARQSG